MILLDTCAILWWVFNPSELSKKASLHIRKMESSFGYVSSISIWEIGIKVKKKKIEIPISIDELTSRLKRSRVIKIIPVDETIWINSIQLNWKNQDPADRVIVATASQLAVPIVTSDKEMRNAFKKNTIW